MTFSVLKVGGLLSGVASVLGNVKNTATARCMTYLQKKNWKSSTKASTTKEKQETQPEAPIIAELEVWTRNFYKEGGAGVDLWGTLMLVPSILYEYILNW
jgi:hypothetical protein